MSDLTVYNVPEDKIDPDLIKDRGSDEKGNYLIIDEYKSHKKIIDDEDKELYKMVNRWDITYDRLKEAKEVGTDPDIDNKLAAFLNYIRGIYISASIEEAIYDILDLLNPKKDLSEERLEVDLGLHDRYLSHFAACESHNILSDIECTLNKLEDR